MFEKIQNQLAIIVAAQDNILSSLGNLQRQIKNGDNIRTTGNGKDDSVARDSGERTTIVHAPREDSLSFIYEEGRFRSRRASDQTVPATEITIRVFSNSPLVVFQTDGSIELRGI